MRPKRLLIGTVFLAALSTSASAADFWGKTLPNQPTDFIFGYGSLIETDSRNSTASQPIHALPVRVSAAFGYVRTWDDRSSSGFTALGLARPLAGQQAMTINGVVFPVEGEDMTAFDAREKGYARVEVPRADIQAVSWEQLPAQGKIWVYIPILPGEPAGVDLPLPNASYPLLQSYIDVVLQGGLEYSPDFAREIIQTTIGWNKYWLNDRQLARRPWVFDKSYDRVDALLAPLVPNYADRVFPEQYPAEDVVAK
jgi:hypothetical protein